MKRGLSQESLKLLACVVMLIDHIGAVFVPGYALRCIGRLAFPLYCFLLAEGVHHTKHPWRYGLRLAIGAALSELPFDLLLYGGVTWQHQSVMVTLFLGFCAGMCMKRTGDLLLKTLLVVPFAVAAEWLGTDYGGMGVILIGLFLLSRNMPLKGLIQFLGMVVIFGLMASPRIYEIGGFNITIQMLGALAIVPIALYSGRKATKSKAVQLAFYLFYPVHLVVLLILAK